MKIEKTNAVRMLDKEKVEYELIHYEVNEVDLSAIHVVQSLGEDIKTVFKTLVLKGDKIGYFVCVIPGAEELDLKAAAKISGNKNCDMIPMKELLPTTGYINIGNAFLLLSVILDFHNNGIIYFRNALQC